MTARGQAEGGPAISSRNFGFVAHLLTPATRTDAAELYAFCRYVDDLADEAPDRLAAASELLRVLASIERGVPCNARTAMLLQLAGRFPGLLESASELLHGVMGDLDPVCIEDDAALRRYCHQVAGTVGEMMCSVLGASGPEARRRAEMLGAAMQMTNIARDVLEDAQRGRVYLPASRLGALSPAEVAHPHDAARERIQAVVAWLLEEAEVAYASAAEGLRFLGLRNRYATAVALAVYRGIGIWQGRVSLSNGQRIKLALAASGPAFAGRATRASPELSPWLAWPPSGTAAN